MENQAHNQPPQGRPLTAQGVLRILAVFAGLCAVFALVVSIADAWREHAQQTWPEVTATVQRCSVDPYVPIRGNHAPVWTVQCRIAYRAGGEEVEGRIHSRSTTSGWGGDVDSMRRWVTSHRSGSPIVVNYDPAEPKTVVLTRTDMPLGGPRTPTDLRLLLISSGASLLLFLAARSVPGWKSGETRPRS